MGNVAIRVEGLGKMYRIGGKQERYRTLRDTLTDAFAAPFRRASSLLRGQAYGASGLNETIWALKDVSFEVKHGEVVGIIGRNGAGKSTLLKILSRITEPTEGYADVYGRVGSLLEVGTGFHPELTGRENIYLNGAILGMSRAEIDRKFDEIVAFAEIEKFIDTPVKHYSSGMGLRLGFAVAAHLEPEILVVDEVLAVGDAQFQKKCLGKMSEVAGEGRTVLFVSHNMGAIRHLCGRAIWLDNGHRRMDGGSAQVVARYLTAISEGQLASQTRDRVRITRIVLRDRQGRPTSTFCPGDEVEVLVYYSTHERFYSPYFWISVNGKYGGICSANMLLDGQTPEFIEGEGILGCRFKTLPLLPESYTLKMAIRGRDGKEPLFHPQDVASFHIVGDVSDFGLYGEQANRLASNSVPLILPYEWHFPDGSIVPVEIKAREGGTSSAGGTSNIG